MPEDFAKLVEVCESTMPSSLTLVGSFKNWPGHPNGLEIQEFLMRLFKSAEIPRVWNISFDLHHDLKDLFYGTKTSPSVLDEARNSLDVFLSDYFNMVAWGYENLDTHHELPQFLNLEESEREIWNSRHKQAIATKKAIMSQVYNRMDFFHVATIQEIPTLIRILSCFKLMKLSILGAPYPTRVFIQRVSSEISNSYRLVRVLNVSLNFLEKAINKLVRILTRKSYNNVRIKIYLRYLKQTFIAGISTFSWVDGSSLNYPVRKYLEMPLCNSIVLTPYSPTIKAMGFEDNRTVNTVEILNASERLGDIFRTPRKLRKRMRNESKELVLKLHSPSQRLDQLRRFIESYDPNVITSAGIENGTFVINHSA